MSYSSLNKHIQFCFMLQTFVALTKVYYCNTNISANAGVCTVTVSSWLADPVSQRFHYWQRQRFLGALAKLRKATISFVMSVCLSIRPHGTPPFSLNGFPLNLILSIFRKIRRENSSFLKIWQEKRVLRMETYVHYDNISLSSSSNEKYFRQNL